MYRKIARIKRYNFNKFGNTKLENRIVIVGSGPAGLLCAYMLATNGYPVTLIERGEKVEDRIKYVSRILNIDINKYKPKDIDGIEHMLGLFDLDAHYEVFKTLRC